jgi:hypothetical protein
VQVRHVNLLQAFREPQQIRVSADGGEAIQRDQGRSGTIAAAPYHHALRQTPRVGKEDLVKFTDCNGPFGLFIVFSSVRRHQNNLGAFHQPDGGSPTRRPALQ